MLEVVQKPVTFCPVRRRPRLAEAIVETVVKTIVEGHLRPGDALPTEKELCDQFEVSRQVVREALQALAGRGVIEPRQSASAVVAAANPVVASTSLMLYLHTVADDEKRLVREVRLVLEPAIAAQAALRATDADIAALRACHDRVVTAVGAYRRSRGPLRPAVVEEVLEADFEFHLQLTRATHNGVYLIMLEGMRSAQMVDRRMDVSRPGDLRHELERNVGELLSILNAVTAGDADGARLAMLAHFAARLSGSSRTSQLGGGTRSSSE